MQCRSAWATVQGRLEAPPRRQVFESIADREHGLAALQIDLSCREERVTGKCVQEWISGCWRDADVEVDRLCRSVVVSRIALKRERDGR